MPVDGDIDCQASHDSSTPLLTSRTYALTDALGYGC